MPMITNSELALLKRDALNYYKWTNACEDYFKGLQAQLAQDDVEGNTDSQDYILDCGRYEGVKHMLDCRLKILEDTRNESNE